MSGTTIITTGSQTTDHSCQRVSSVLEKKKKKSSWLSNLKLALFSPCFHLEGVEEPMKIKKGHAKVAPKVSVSELAIGP